MMVFFIAIPLLSVVFQSFQFKQELLETREQEQCDPFGCTVSIVVDNEETSKIREAKPLGKFNGFGTYTDRNHLAVDEIKKFWKFYIRLKKIPKDTKCGKNIIQVLQD